MEKELGEILNMDIQEGKAKKLIGWAVEKYPRIALACSFGKDSITVLHLALQVDPTIKVFHVETPFLPKETLEYKERIVKEWNLNIKTFRSKAEVPDGFYLQNPDECCRVFKVEPTKWALKELNLQAWIAGLRKTEGITRGQFKKVEFYEGGIVKVNPILDWEEWEVWRYLAIHQIPTNPLYARGFRSLGCEPCSKPYTETERGGRWSFSPTKRGGECGIHSCMLRRIT